VKKMKKKKKKGFELSKRISNRLSYTIIAFVALMLIGVFVFAATPNPGHDITQISPPSVCGSNQFLKWTGSAWACADVGGGSGETPTLAEVLTEGNDAGGKSIYGVNHLNLVEGGKFYTYYYGVVIEAGNIDATGTIDAGKVQANQFCIGSSCINDWKKAGKRSGMSYNGFIYCAEGITYSSNYFTCHSPRVDYSLLDEDGTWQLWENQFIATYKDYPFSENIAWSVCAALGGKYVSKIAADESPPSPAESTAKITADIGGFAGVQWWTYFGNNNHYIDSITCSFT